MLNCPRSFCRGLLVTSTGWLRVLRAWTHRHGTLRKERSLSGRMERGVGDARGTPEEGEEGTHQGSIALSSSGSCF